jgi:1,4-alpha-glucan branching enzyme
MFTAPGIPMLFQGQEFLQGDWFKDTVPLDWDQGETFRGIVRLYRDLVRLRLNRGGVTRGLTGHCMAVHRIDEENKLVAFRRWHEGGPGDDVVVVANFSHKERGVYRIGFPREGLWKLRLNTDWSGYSEDFGELDSNDVAVEAQESDGLPWSAEVAVGPYGTLIFSQED